MKNNAINPELDDDLPEGWLGREQQAERFTRIIQSDIDCPVVSIEGGFGYGKSIFAKKWVKQLELAGETVIYFDAWESDHTDDPLVSFVAKLIEHMPSREDGTASGKRESGKKGLVKLLKIGAVIGGKFAAGKYGADTVAEYFDLPEDSDERKVLEEFAEAIGKEASGQVISLLAAQLMAEKARKKDLPEQLEALRDELEAQKEECYRKGRVIVIIDELDRCRPDYAISLLEAIKHLFRKTGFVFVLMINPNQLERTAARLFGDPDGGEPYFGKFIDLRLPLAPPNYEDLAFNELLPIKDEFILPKQVEEMSFNSAVHYFADYACRLGATPRQMIATVQHVRTANAMGKNSYVDLTYLLCKALDARFTRLGVPQEISAETDIPWLSAAIKLVDRFENLEAVRQSAGSFGAIETSSEYYAEFASIYNDISYDLAPMLNSHTNLERIKSNSHPEDIAKYSNFLKYLQERIRTHYKGKMDSMLQMADPTFR